RSVKKQVALTEVVVRGQVASPVAVDHFETPALRSRDHFKCPCAAQTKEAILTVEGYSRKSSRPVGAVREILAEIMQDSLGPLSARAKVKLEYCSVAVRAPAPGYPEQTTPRVTN